MDVARSLPSRRRIVFAVALAVVLATIALLLLVLGRGSDEDERGPARASLRVVPDDALIAVHVSTDGRRDPVAEATRRLARVPGWGGLRDRLLRDLSPADCRAFDRVPGREATVAIVPTGGGRAASLAIVDTGQRHERASPRRCGGRQAAYLGRLYVVGTPEAVRIARRLHDGDGRGRSLAEQPLYRRLMAGLPDDRVADAWLSPDGVRRVLAPRRGVAGAIAALLDRPGLQGTVVAATPTGSGVRLTLHLRAPQGPGQPFDSGTTTAAPASAIGSLLTNDPTGAASRFLTVTGDGGFSSDLGPLLARLTTEADRASGGRVQRDLLGAVRGPSEVILMPPGGRERTAGLVVVVPVTDGRRAAGALASMRSRVAAALTAPGERRRFRRTTVAGRRAWTLPVAGRGTIGYLVDGNRVLGFSSRRAAAAVLAPGTRLSAGRSWRQAVGERSKSVMSIGFLDFSELLRVTEQTGIGTLAEYRAARRTLQRVRSAGLQTRTQDDETIVDVDLRIP